MTIQRFETGPRMSQVVVHNKTIYLAGQVSEAPAGKDVAEQTRDILAGIDRLLSLAGSDKRHLLSATIWLTDMATFGAMNKVWEGWVAQGATPARATVLSPQLAGTDFHIEIGIIAAQP